MVLFLLLNVPITDAQNHLADTQEGGKLPFPPHLAPPSALIVSSGVFKEKAIGKTGWRTGKMSQEVRVLAGKA